jgi:secretion/DNA translocation related TadE-like protein
VLVLALVAAALTLASAAAVVSQAAVARHRAEAAADLAALAAADVLVGRAPGEPCARARLTATANGGRVLTCTPAADGSVTVRVAVRPAGAAARVGDATGAARAGPPSLRPAPPGP